MTRPEKNMFTLEGAEFILSMLYALDNTLHKANKEDLAEKILHLDDLAYWKLATTLDELMDIINAVHKKAGFDITVYKSTFNLSNPKRSGVESPKRKTITQKKRLSIFERDGFKCVFCGIGSDESKITIDHIIPVVKGGSDDKENLQTLCDKCNSAKSDNIIEFPQR